MRTPIDNEGPRCERGPIPKCDDDQEYAMQIKTMQEIAPSWYPEGLREQVQIILALAAPDQVIPGKTDSASAFIPGAGVLSLYFDGTGGVMIDPESSFTPAIRELAKVLKVVMGHKLTVGTPAVNP